MTTPKTQSLQNIIGQLRNDLEVVERKWDNYSEGRVPNSGRDSFLNGIQGYYRLRPTEGRQTFCIGDIAMVHDTLHLHRRYNSRAAVEKVLDVIVDLRLLRWNVERLLRTIGNATNTAASREKLLSLQNDTATWKEILGDKFSLVEMSAPSSPLFLRTLGDVLWKSMNSATMIANFLLEATENGWPGSLQLMWRKIASRELHASEAFDRMTVKSYGADGKKTYYKRGSEKSLDARELDKLISQKQKLLKSMESDQRRKRKSDYPWDEGEEEDDFSIEDINTPEEKPNETPREKPEKLPRKGVKVKFDDEASVISTEGNITVQIINSDRNSSRTSMYPIQAVQSYPALTNSSPPPQRATYIRSLKDDENENEKNKTKPYLDIVKDNDNNVVLIRRPQMEKQVLLPSLLPRLSSASLRPSRVLLTEIPEKEEASVSTKDLKNMIHKIEDIDGTVVDINGDMRKELTRLRTSIKLRMRAVQQKINELDFTVDRVANTML